MIRPIAWTRIPAPARAGLMAFVMTATGVLAVTGIGSSTAAQSITGFDANQPVNYAANRIELQDRDNRVVLSGNVVIDQGDLRLVAGRTIVNYTDAGSLSIERITATGGVRVTRGDEIASGDVGLYDFNRRIITLTGGVALRRGSDTLNGGRLTIDLNTGLSSVDGSSAASSAVSGDGTNARVTNGRVTGSFSVPQQ